MPELVKLGQELADRGLVIVGINFDDAQAKAQEAITKHGLTWAQVSAKEAAKGDKNLWRDAASIEGLPRLLILDRQGVLRHDVYPNNLRSLVLELLDEKAK
jgi:hypothetical protein